MAVLTRRERLCLDVFEVLVTHVDHKPVADGSRVRLLSNGRILISEDGSWKSVTKEEIERAMGPILKKYGISSRSRGPGVAVPWMVMFCREGAEPDQMMEEGWLSIALDARNEEEARRWAQHRMGKLASLLRGEWEIYRAEPYKPTPAFAGPYRGIVLNM
jgi:hypothetical protein